MTYAQNANSAYSQASKTVSPLRAIVMLYDGIIQATGQARLAIEEERIEDRFTATQKACKIVLGLQANLDFDQGGDVSVTLDQFYHRVFRELQQINFANSVDACDLVTALVTEVRDSWRHLAENEAKVSAPPRALPTAAAPRADNRQQPGAPASGGLTLSV